MVQCITHLQSSILCVIVHYVVQIRCHGVVTTTESKELQSVKLLWQNSLVRAGMMAKIG